MLDSGCLMGGLTAECGGLSYIPQVASRILLAESRTLNPTSGPYTAIGKALIRTVTVLARLP